MLFDSIEIDLLQDSNREMITENRMAIKNCTLTEATVNEYLGEEIKGYQEAGLLPYQRYKVYRPLAEIEKVLLQYNGLDVIDNHHSMNGMKDNRKFAVGATGESATLDGNKVLNTVFITDRQAIIDIEMATKSRGQYGKRCLSCSYDYTPIFEKGVFGNKHYDVRIIDLKLDHVALVQEGRVQSAKIADSNHLLKGINMNFEVMKTALKGLFGIETVNDHQIEQLMVFSDKAKDEEHEKEKHVKDKKAKDKEHDEAEDSEEKDKEELERIKKMEKHEKEEIKGKDKKAKDKEHKEKDCMDSEEEKEKKEHHEKEIKDAITKELKEIRTIQSLCSKVIGGALSDTALALDKEVLLNDTLKTLKQNVEGKSYEMQKVMLETLANANISNTSNKQKIGFSDSNTTSSKSFVYTADDINKLGGK